MQLAIGFIGTLYCQCPAMGISRQQRLAQPRLADRHGHVAEKRKRHCAADHRVNSFAIARRQAKVRQVDGQTGVQEEAAGTPDQRRSPPR